MANEHNVDDLPRALEAVLNRWESNRATDTIDQLIERGIPQSVDQAIVTPERRLSVKTAEIHTKQWQVEAQIDTEKYGIKAPPPNTPPGMPSSTAE